MKVFITPTFTGADTGEGGIRRVVEAQRKWLPTVGVEVVDAVEDCDVIGAHAVEWPLVDKPVVSHNHGLYWSEYEWPKWALNANVRVLESLLRADEVTAVSEWVAKAIERNTWIKPTVVYHGIDAKEWPRVGRAVGVPDYVLWNKTRVDSICDPEAVRKLAERCGDIQFVTTFVGGDEKARAANIRVTGKVPYENAKSIIRNAAVYLCTARETMGIGTLEAMAAGLPVVGWAWGGQREIIENGVDGWLATPGDYLDLEEGLRQCLTHRKKWGAAARDKVLARFQWKSVIAGYVPVYERAIARWALSSGIKVSVVIPCYNLGSMLPDAVQSAMHQADEVVIVDDASTDDSGDIADSLAGAYSGNKCNVRVVHNSTNQYLAGALNAGIAAAWGEYIVPLDADNLLADGAISAMAGALDADAGLDVAYGGMSVIEPDGREWTSPWPTDFNFAQQMTHHNQIPSTSMYRRRVWERIGGYRRRCRTAEDADFWCRATSYGAVARKVTGNVVLRYRNREDSMSHTEPDWPWNKWYPWWRDPRMAPPISPMLGPIWSYEPIKISVVVPVGPGHERMVVDALDSLASQTFRWWEAIVVNDTEADIPWVHPFARVLRSSPDGRSHRGPAVARNIGIAAAQGSLVVFLDADDFLQPDALEQMWSEWLSLGKDAARSYVYTDWIVQETGEVKEAEEYSCEGLLAKLPHAVTAAYPLAAVKAVGGFDETMAAWEDWDFVLALGAAGYCGHRLAVPLIHYRMKAGSRRESMYARRGELIEHIKAKWSDYYTGAKTMACGSCGQRAQQQTAQGAMSNGNGSRGILSPANAAQEDAVLIEYTGRASGPMVYRGAVTGTPYRFGLDPHHKLRYVLAADAPGLLLRSDFKVGHASQELLQAAGV